jgi:cell division protease FtsH
MSERHAPRTYGRKEEMVFLGREISEQRNYSEKVAEQIDDEVRRIIDHAYHTARKTLSENRAKLDQIARRLIEVETIEGAELQALFEAPADQEFTPPAAEEKPPAPTEPGEEEQPAEEAPPTPKVPKPGLAWGGGSATTT